MRHLLGLLAAALLVLASSASMYATAQDAATATIPFTDGRGIYDHICRGCHMPEGAGAVGAGHYPALAKNPLLKSRDYMALTVLAGRRNMPAFGARLGVGFGGPAATLNDAQIAAVINYVRSNFGNNYKDSITAADVAKLDRALQTGTASK